MGRLHLILLRCCQEMTHREYTERNDLWLKPHIFQLKIINQPFHLGVLLRVDELGGFEEGFGMLLHRFRVKPGMMGIRMFGKVLFLGVVMVAAR